MELFHGLPPPRQNIYIGKKFNKNLKQQNKIQNVGRLSW